MSGSVLVSHATRLSRRLLMLLMLKVAIFKPGLTYNLVCRSLQSNIEWPIIRNMQPLALVIGLTIAFSGFAQQAAGPKLEFEVASIKLVNPPMGNHAVGLRATHGSAKLVGATLRQIIVQAYGVQRVRVLGGPSWYDEDQYDLDAKAASSDATPEQIRQMLQALLADRFKLAIHRETRELRMYSLAIAKDGSKLQTAQNHERSTVELGEPGQIVYRNQPLAALVNTVANMMDTAVDDNTGLKDMYDYTLEFTFNDPTRSAAPAAGGAGGAPMRPDPRDFIPEAVEKLGLKLESKKGPTEVLVVDHAERASPN
jgi:uncharacterized protein (TIGR03435 family)